VQLIGRSHLVISLKNISFIELVFAKAFSLGFEEEANQKKKKKKKKKEISFKK